MAVTHKPVTAEELSRIPDDGLQRELVQGEARRTAPAGHRHARIVLKVTTPLDRYVHEKGLGIALAAETGDGGDVVPGWTLPVADILN